MTLATTLAFEGYRTITAANGRQALDALDLNEPPGLIILDQQMPVMRGSEFLRRLGAQGLYPRIPVVVMSANRQSDTLPPGFVAFLAKPFNADELLGLVAAHRGHPVN